MNTKVDEINAEITALKQLLTNTDYQALKYSEGFYTDDEYAEIKAARQSYRDQINTLEVELASLDE